MSTSTSPSWSQQFSVTLLVEGAIILVASTAWNNAIQALIDRVYPIGDDAGVWAKFVYAAIVTVIALVLILVVWYSATYGEEYIEQYAYFFHGGQVVQQRVLVPKPKSTPQLPPLALTSGGTKPASTVIVMPPPGAPTPPGTIVKN